MEASQPLLKDHLNSHRMLKLLVIGVILISVFAFILVILEILMHTNDSQINVNRNSDNTPISYTNPTDSSQTNPQEVPDRLKITTPVQNQVLIGQELLVEGQMKGFFEGVMNINLKNENGTVIYTDSIQADGDNYIDYAHFSKEVSIPNAVNLTGSVLTLEFSETSMQDGSETVLLSMTLGNVQL